MTENFEVIGDEISFETKERIWTQISIEIIAICSCGYEISFLEDFLDENHGIKWPCECWDNGE